MGGTELLWRLQKASFSRITIYHPPTKEKKEEKKRRLIPSLRCGIITRLHQLPLNGKPFMRGQFVNVQLHLLHFSVPSYERTPVMSGQYWSACVCMGSLCRFIVA